MGTWDTPPTEDEIKKSGAFDTPPTEDEIAAAPTPEYGFAYPDPAAVAPEEKERIVSQGLNVPATWLTDDAETNRRMGENAWERGATRPTTTGDAVRASMLVGGGMLAPVAGVPAAAAGGALGAGGVSQADTAPGVAWDMAKGAVSSGVAAKVAPPIVEKLAEKVPALRRAMEWASGLLDDGAEGAGRAAGALPDSSPLPSASAVPSHAAPPTTTVASHGPAPKPLLARILQEPEMTPEAKFLADRGVKLTTGLRDATSPAAHTEIASQSIMGSGPIIRSQRHRALEQAMDLGFEMARPPGAPTLGATGNVNAKFAKLEQAWDRAYDSVKASAGDVYPAIHNGKGGIPLIGTAKRPGAIARALRDPDLLADKESIGLVERYVENQFTKIPQKPGALGQVGVSDLLDIRTNLRRQARQALSSQKYERFRLFDAADDQITKAIESQAPEEAVAQLQSLDSKYRNLVIMREAVTRAKDAPGGLSPQSLSNAVYAAESSSAAYARGEGGELRELSKAIKSVFDESSAPPTGARILAVGALPEWARNSVVGPSIAVRNAQLARPPTVTPPRLPPPALPGAALVPLGQKTDVGELMRFLRDRVGQASAAADEEDR